MADLTPYIQGFRLQGGVRTLRRSFSTSHDALLTAAEEAEGEWLRHEQSVGGGPDTIGWTDGYSILTTSEILKLRTINAWEAAAELRAAFIIALYHHWERCVFCWGEGKSSTHKDHLKTLYGLGYSADLNLDKAYRLASLLKHNSDRHGKKLWALWPEVFSTTFTPRENADWYGGLNLTADHVDEVAEIIARSGPQ
ncbi:MAG: hypothetical protein DI623_07620 [Sphingomonas sanxanigenens]|uniref:Uncharacterized protein n=1 Tax=Sphingomonas sanxanigenens TaxID=397260 RepID=A0A2W5AAA1_9SPHN|nr:MAG: hypothetical protein DI623_07620 [Sphingomonas sanxanigenens]